jgi:hypothetical protein
MSCPRAFRSPFEQPDAQLRFADPRLFYVFDDPDCGFLIPAHRGAASRALASSIARISGIFLSFTYRISGGRHLALIAFSCRP